MTRKNPGAGKTRTPWPFKDGKYLSTRSVSRDSVHQGASVDTLRGKLGLHHGEYDETTRGMVMDAQERAGLPVTGVVTEADWDVIVNPVRARKSAARTRRMDAAQKPDKSVGELDPPEGAE